MATTRGPDSGLRSVLLRGIGEFDPVL